MTHPGPQHFADIAHPLIQTLKPRTEPAMTDKPIADDIRPGVTEYVQRFVRAHLPDGRIDDSRVKTLTGTPHPIAAWSEAFGRMHFPEGTRFEEMRRTVRIEATPWESLTQSDAQLDTMRG
jgi:hypothetical protein